MFEEAFKKELASITNNEIIIGKLWDEIKIQYSKRNRYYHNLSHLDKLVALLSGVSNQIKDWQTVILSVAYHDIIYNPLKNDNEEKSATLAVQRLTELHLPESQCDKCFSQILSTKGHEISKDDDTNLFTDADLAILGSDSESYTHYAKMIRKEYKFYPDLIYRQGRKKVLQHFRQMPYIFKTDYFRDQFESQARINLNNEFKELS